MFFALATDDRGLMAFPTKEALIAYCEGIDVENGNYLFWDADGNPLKAQFSRPNNRGRFWIASGDYDLLPSSNGDPLIDALSKVRYLDSNPIFSSIEAVRRHLTSR